MDIVLASASPRRKQLLSSIITSFRQVVTDCEEQMYGRPSDAVKRIARDKALSYKGDYDVLIAADTIVYHKGIIGKPHSIEHARSIIKSLCGIDHYVYTGVCIITRDEMITFYDKSTVRIRPMTDSEIDDYIRNYNPIDKAGAYGIQDGIVQSYNGSYTNIVGLPMESLTEALMKLGVLEDKNGNN